MQIHDPHLRFRSLPRQRQATRKIIVHHGGRGTEDWTARRVHEDHITRVTDDGVPWIGIGYNAWIRPDGLIEQGRPLECVGAHTLGENSDSVGIGLAGNLDEHPPTRAQMDALVSLIRHCRSRWGDLPVYGHNYYNPTSCPGRHFPWDRLRARLDDQEQTGSVITIPRTEIQADGTVSSELAAAALLPLFAAGFVAILWAMISGLWSD